MTPAAPCRMSSRSIEPTPVGHPRRYSQFGLMDPNISRSRRVATSLPRMAPLCQFPIQALATSLMGLSSTTSRARFLEIRSLSFHWPAQHRKLRDFETVPAASELDARAENASGSDLPRSSRWSAQHSLVLRAASGVFEPIGTIRSEQNASL